MKPDGTPRQSLFSPGLKGCTRPLDGEYGGDLSFHQGKAGFEAATLGLPFKPIRIAPVAVAQGLRGMTVDDMTIVALTPAADGAARVYVNGGSSWDGVVLVKCAS